MAFDAAYEGPREVYTLPLQGGLAERQTWDGSCATVVGWTPDGEHPLRDRALLDAAERSAVRGRPTDTRDVARPARPGRDGTFDANGARCTSRGCRSRAATRSATGAAPRRTLEVDRRTGEATPLTADFAGTSKQPMLWKGRVYFVSDRDGTMNLWSMDATAATSASTPRQATYDVQSPSLSDGRIAYQLGADLRVYDIAADATRPSRSRSSRTSIRCASAG